MRIAVLSYGSEQTPSTRFRFGACRELWARQGHVLDILPSRQLPDDFWSRLGQYDVVVNQKGLLSRPFGRRLLAAGVPVFFDFDDAIWTRPGKPYSWWTQWRVNHRMFFWFQRTRGIIAANEVLAGQARHFAENVHVVPMALDLRVWQPRPPAARAGVRLGWIGSPGNMRYLEQLRDVLRQVLRTFPAAQLAVFCGARPQLDLPYEYHPFDPEREAAFVGSLDIGLLPLVPEPYSYGKSPIKALQYLSCGVPVVANVFGAGREILNPHNSLAVTSPDEWFSALAELINQPGKRRELGATGRDWVGRHFNLEKTSTALLEILRTAGERRPDPRRPALA